LLDHYHTYRNEGRHLITLINRRINALNINLTRRSGSNDEPMSIVVDSTGINKGN